jgi:hypothetical protein
MVVRRLPIKQYKAKPVQKWKGSGGSLGLDRASWTARSWALSAKHVVGGGIGPWKTYAAFMRLHMSLRETRAGD